MRYVWIPRLIERIRAATSESSSGQQASITTTNQIGYANSTGSVQVDPSLLQPELSGTSSDSPVSDLTDYYNPQTVSNYGNNLQRVSGLYPENNLAGTWGRVDDCDFQVTEEIQSHDNWFGGGGDSMESVWNEENIWFLQQQLYDEV